MPFLNSSEPKISRSLVASDCTAGSAFRKESTRELSRDAATDFIWFTVDMPMTAAATAV